MTTTKLQSPSRRLIAGTVLAVVAVLGPGVWCFGQSVAEQTPRELEGVEIAPNMGGELPLELVFTNDKGEEVRLGDLITGDKPVILTPVYFECPMLCTLVLNGLVDGLNQIEMSAGAEFDIITYSFNEDETSELSNRKKRAYLTQYDRDTAAAGWHFLTGSKKSIDELSDTIGFKFKRQPNGEIAHSASVVFITPDGKISRYMNDVLFKPRDLKLALVDASEGTISAPIERFLLFTCFQYDPDAGGYVASAWKIMRFFGGLTVVVLAVSLFYLFRMDAKRGSAPPGNGPSLAGTRLAAAESGLQS